MNIDFTSIIRSVYDEVSRMDDPGQVAQYIPELAGIPSEKLGVHLCTLDGQDYGIGDHQEKFSIQSIAKVLSLTMAFREKGDELWNRVGVEPSGNPFNSLWQLENEKGKPRNPLINSGAIVICDILCSVCRDPLDELISFVRELSGIRTIDYNRAMAQSEKSIGFRNSALINMMKSSGNIENSIDKVMNLYYHMCSIEMSCEELARTFLFYANHGKLIDLGHPVISSSMAKRINAIMQTCGFYDEAGEFTFKVGLPGKSGVGGGIVAVHPGVYSVAVWSPRLNKKGNSVKGMRILEMLTTRSGLSIF